jgi:GNAT superfamily N-acetyltransferase
MDLRSATAPDLGELQALYRRSAAHWPDNRQLVIDHPEWTEPTPSQIEAGWVYLAQDGGRIVGFSTVTPERELEALFVDPDAMGRGVGRALVEAAGKPLLVTANVNAVPFYMRVGFIDLGRMDTLFGEARRMQLA